VGEDWRAKKASTGVEPGTSTAVWANLGTCSPAASATSIELTPYPNPFNPSTNLVFVVPARAWTRLDIFDALGRFVSSPVDGMLEPGSHAVRFDGSGLPGGTYLIRLRIGERTTVRSVLLLK
jgi:hypothetical protein